MSLFAEVVINIVEFTVVIGTPGSRDIWGCRVSQVAAHDRHPLGDHTSGCAGQEKTRDRTAIK